MQNQEKMQQAGIAAQEKINEREDFNKEEDRKVKYAEIEASKWKVLVEQDNKLNLEGVRRIDSDSNGIDDRLDLERTEIDKEYKQGSLELKSKEVNEKIRSNKENEAIKRANAKKNASSN